MTMAENYWFCRVKSGGWQLIGIYADEHVEDEPFCLFFVVTMIHQSFQSNDIKIHIPPPESLKEKL